MLVGVPDRAVKLDRQARDRYGRVGAARLDPARRRADRHVSALERLERIGDARGRELGLHAGIHRPVLQRLEAPDRFAELDARLQVLEGDLERAPGHAQQFGALRNPRRIVGVVDRSARSVARSESIRERDRDLHEAESAQTPSRRCAALPSTRCPAARPAPRRDPGSRLPAHTRSTRPRRARARRTASSRRSGSARLAPSPLQRSAPARADRAAPATPILRSCARTRRPRPRYCATRSRAPCRVRQRSAPRRRRRARASGSGPPPRRSPQLRAGPIRGRPAPRERGWRASRPRRSPARRPARIPDSRRAACAAA